ncbi:hypothetical protein A2U01_0089924, partial [Trifolium medium]|nr:hypothetical protein [Trifolium medium]
MEEEEPKVDIVVATASFGHRVLHLRTVRRCGCYGLLCRRSSDHFRDCCFFLYCYCSRDFHWRDV